MVVLSPCSLVARERKRKASRSADQVQVITGFRIIKSAGWRCFLANKSCAACLFIDSQPETQISWNSLLTLAVLLQALKRRRRHWRMLRLFPFSRNWVCICCNKNNLEVASTSPFLHPQSNNCLAQSTSVLECSSAAQFTVPIHYAACRRQKTQRFTSFGLSICAMENGFPHVVHCNTKCFGLQPKWQDAAESGELGGHTACLTGPQTGGSWLIRIWMFSKVNYRRFRCLIFSDVFHYCWRCYLVYLSTHGLPLLYHHRDVISVFHIPQPHRLVLVRKSQKQTFRQP